MSLVKVYQHDKNYFKLEKPSLGKVYSMCTSEETGCLSSTAASHQGAI